MFTVSEIMFTEYLIMVKTGNLEFVITVLYLALILLGFNAPWIFRQLLPNHALQRDIGS